MASNVFKDCRDKCSGSGNYIQCYRVCLDQPTINLVKKYFGEKSAEDCYGYNQMIVNAAYNFDKKFIDEAKKQGESTDYKDYQKYGNITGTGPIRNFVQEYYMMPIAPYPPKKDQAPIGITNAKPDLESLKNFFGTNPCYQKQLIAQACEKVPGKCTPEFLANALKSLSLNGADTTDRAASNVGKVAALAAGAMLGLALMSAIKY